MPIFVPRFLTDKRQSHNTLAERAIEQLKTENQLPDLWSPRPFTPLCYRAFRAMQLSPWSDEDSHSNLLSGTCKAFLQGKSAWLLHFIAQHPVLCIVRKTSFSTGLAIENLHETTVSKECY